MLDKLCFQGKWVVVALLLLANSPPTYGDASDDILFFLPAILSNPNKPTPTPSPPTNPQPQPDGVYIEKTNQDVGFFGRVSFVGEIFNNTDSKIKNVQAIAFVENDGATVGVISEFAGLTVIPPRSRTCFRIDSFFEEGDFDNVEFGVSNTFNTDEEIPDIAVINVSERIDVIGATDERLALLGQIRNDSTSPVDIVRVVATIYDEGGSVSQCEDSLVITSTFQPGSIADFVILTGQQAADVDSYVLQTNSRFEL